MFALEYRVHDDAGNALAQPPRDAFPVRFEAGYRRNGAPSGRQSFGNRRIVGRWQVCGEPTAFGGQASQTGRRAPPHEAASRNIAVRIALPHAQQGLSVVVHFDLPSTHHFPRKKVAEGSDEWVKSEMPVAYFFSGGGANTPIIVRILYADHGLAPLRRSCTGSYTPILKWILCADR